MESDKRHLLFSTEATITQLEYDPERGLITFVLQPLYLEPDYYRMTLWDECLTEREFGRVRAELARHNTWQFKYDGKTSQVSHYSPVRRGCSIKIRLFIHNPVVLNKILPISSFSSPLIIIIFL
jgi:hypothetical protein